MTYLMEDVNIAPVGPEQHFFGRGKLLLSGEYFVLDGALALALPVKVGQSLSVKYQHSYSPTLNWKSFDVNGQCWLEANFEFWHFDCLDQNPSESVKILQRVLRQARKQNPHFLRDEVDVKVETKLGFPLEWGLGSSSTLVYNISQWAYVSPFELLFKAYGGSGYDIACAQSNGPILYQVKDQGPNWAMTSFDPPFKQNLYFIYLGRKQDSKEGINLYRSKAPFSAELVSNLSRITEDMVNANSLEEFNFLIKAHEDLVAKNLGLTRSKDIFFSDYWGEVKSLGAWGGDFVLVTSNRPHEETKQYFASKGFHVVLPYQELILGKEDIGASFEQKKYRVIH